MPGALAKAPNLRLNALVGHAQCGPLLVQKAKLAKPGQARRAVLAPDQRTWAFNYVKNTVGKVSGGKARSRLMEISEGGSSWKSAIEFSSADVDHITASFAEDAARPSARHRDWAVLNRNTRGVRLISGAVL